MWERYTLSNSALNEQKTEVRIQFKNVPGNIYNDISRNELVLRIQPNEAMYMKFMNKTPGLSSKPVVSELDLSYNKRYSEHHIPDAYESLILDALNADKSNFVRDDELEAAWKIFTPLLHHIETEKVQPYEYTYGTRGPHQLPEFIKGIFYLMEGQGYKRTEDYVWSPSKM